MPNEIAAKSPPADDTLITLQAGRGIAALAVLFHHARNGAKWNAALVVASLATCGLFRGRQPPLVGDLWPRPRADPFASGSRGALRFGKGGPGPAATGRSVLRTLIGPLSAGRRHRTVGYPLWQRPLLRNHLHCLDRCRHRLRQDLRAAGAGMATPIERVFSARAPAYGVCRSRPGIAFSESGVTTATQPDLCNHKIRRPPPLEA